MLNADKLFSDSQTLTASKLNAAFLIGLAGEDHPLFTEAKGVLKEGLDTASFSDLANFFIKRISDIEMEVCQADSEDCAFGAALTNLEEYLTATPATDDGQFHNQLMQVFLPEGVNVFSNHQQLAKDLRKSRKVKVKKTNPYPIQEPGRELLFTSNVLLGIPNKNTNVDTLNYDEEFKKTLKEVINEPQSYWYDHPIQIGVAPEANEILYGLMELDKSMEEERKRGNLGSGKVKCLLSVSVTHVGLQKIAKHYIRQELQQHSNLKNLDVFVFTEQDTQLLIDEVFLKIIADDIQTQKAEKLLQVFGVDGEYGRHYSFLKAIAAVWNVFIDKDVKGTFKIDLDQVFPQKELIEQSGASALEHFKTPLWGATGIGNNGKEVELGMIAGALVNEKDISRGLYTPDVTFPETIPDKESSIFFSKMLMALSTEGELMTRYKRNTEFDGESSCIERIHVTGGTNGILVDALRKHRPFTPTFIGRAEDQCYILSVLGEQNEPRLAYLHEDGLIMRHDKEAFAQEALKAAKFGNIIGDYIRTLFFSEYAATITKDVDTLKEIVNPFTGCFISRIPITVCMLRFVLKGNSFFEEGEDAMGNQFFEDNSKRLDRAIQFIEKEDSELKLQVQIEREGWKLFYDTLEKTDDLIDRKDGAVLESVSRARSIIDNCKM